MDKYPKAYVEYLVAYHAERDYFECHEIMEEHWKSEPGSPYRGAWLGLIQLAVGQYHERRGNLAGARKMTAGALRHLEREPLAELGLAGEELLARLRERLSSLEAAGAGGERTFRDLDLPITDERLLQACLAALPDAGSGWGKPSDPAANWLLHKHKLRDRSEVIRERERQRLLREQARLRQKGGRSE
ncbi:hypothetical protein J31TS4_06370 [Paenibacillus sp. J31TS4]|uniref:DUF309 domain-containing protein n=1 Tax=Paenibacillus sp. J31TS4 TaxID=2807195 RepID=UPI001B2D8D73|nr:DUF309 domain-containing protein [Paenibacillus sp. J31TS4]GIP37357.1 hypothetical protein J31TS4_06370 [Paenibacillus sp. J31TS4]